MQALLWSSCRSSCVGLFLAASKNCQQIPTVDVPHVRGYFHKKTEWYPECVQWCGLSRGAPLPFHNLLMKRCCPSFWERLKTFIYQCTCVWNHCLLLGFQNSLPLSLLLQCCRGNRELNAEECCNVWRELKADVSGCLFLWLMPCWCSEDGGFEAVRPGFASSFGTQRCVCNLRLSLSWLWERRQAGGRGIKGYEVLLYLVVLKGELFHLGLLKAGNQELTTVAWRKPPVLLHPESVLVWFLLCWFDRAIWQSNTDLLSSGGLYGEVPWWVAVVSHSKIILLGKEEFLTSLCP